MPLDVTVRSVEPCSGPVMGLRPVTVSCSRHAGHEPSRAVPVKTNAAPSVVYCCPLSVTSTGAACGAARRGALQSSALALSTSAATVAGTVPPKRQRASDAEPEALSGPEMLSRPSRCNMGPRLALVPLGRPKGPPSTVTLVLPSLGPDVGLSAATRGGG